MNSHHDDEDEDVGAGLILAAEECPPETFSKYHNFSPDDDITIRKLIAHGPVLIRGGRGSGKSAFLLESRRRMRMMNGVFPVYVSLRYLPLLQSDGEEYIGHFCTILSEAIQQEIQEEGLDFDFGTVDDQHPLQLGLLALSQGMRKRVVLLFDDAAHIGREKPLEVFFDLFRTLSTNITSCKASIYPGVTKFGVRFDVFNDSTVIDIGRSDVASDSKFFPEVVRTRYPRLSERGAFSDRLSPTQFANLLGRAVVGNLRGFILACNRIGTHDRIGIPEVTKCFLDMATDYYWPLMEEVAPKLGVYESFVEPARELMESILEHLSKSAKDRPKQIAQDRVLIHRQIVGQYSKIIEMLEYLGFVARREASRAMRSGGRGPVFAVNLCNLLDSAPTKRLTIEMIEDWTAGTQEPAELHVSGQPFQNIKLPTLPEEHGLKILRQSISILKKSGAYPYGLTQNMIDRLQGSGIKTVDQLAKSSDERLDKIEYIGPAKVKRIRDIVSQAIWM